MVLSSIPDDIIILNIIYFCQITEKIRPQPKKSGKTNKKYREDSVDSKKVTGKYTHMHKNKILDYLRLFAEVPCLTTSICRKIRWNLKQCSLALELSLPFLACHWQTALVA